MESGNIIKLDWESIKDIYIQFAEMLNETYNIISFLFHSRRVGVTTYYIDDVLTEKIYNERLTSIVAIIEEKNED